MNELYERYKKLNIDGSYIGLEKGDEIGGYFCTPVGAKVIGWDNGIHYCFIDGFGEMVFCVNPETCCDYYVYPLARNFIDFLRLILATKNTNVMQQIILWDKQEYDEFIIAPDTVEFENSEEVVAALNALRTLGITEMENPFAYMKDIQKDFTYDKIQFTNEYYDTLGLDRPDGTEPEDQGYEFDPVAVFVKKHHADVDTQERGIYH